jgi:hypothetical protein
METNIKMTPVWKSESNKLGKTGVFYILVDSILANTKRYITIMEEVDHSQLW